MLFVPNKLRQDRVCAISPGLFLVSVTVLRRETSVSVAWRDENKRKRKNVFGWWERRSRPVILLTESGLAAEAHKVFSDQLAEQLRVLKGRERSTNSYARLEALLSQGTRFAPKQHPEWLQSSLTTLCNVTGTALFSSMSSGSSTAYPLRTNSNPISSFWEERWKGNDVLSEGRANQRK